HKRLTISKVKVKVTFLFLGDAIMAARSQVQDLQEAVFCSICLDYFKDPVILKCGHNFCRACITQYLKESKISPSYPCPQCREAFGEGEFQPNRQLRNVVEIAKKFPDPKGNKASNVTLDPDTAHPRFILSADWKSVRWGDTPQALPNNPERFDTMRCVLGCEGFTSGRHYWEVEVEWGGLWDMGVARESVSRKGRIQVNPEQGIWAVECGEVLYCFSMIHKRHHPFSLSRAPSRIRVYLDCERGQVTFFDAGNEDLIFSFPPASFAGERIRPFFWFSWPGVGVRLTLCP
uniref:Tripartite motif containing 58 n=1 Tax=Terrapene triunguis TaxID=2587831 RepID=A0A674JSH1_9SAUR